MYGRDTMLKNVFNLQLVKSTDVETTNTEANCMMFIYI